MTRTIRYVAVLIVGLLVGLQALAALRLCKQCGYENSRARVTCQHCAARLPPAPRLEDDSGTAPDGDGVTPAQDALVLAVEADVQLAQEQAKAEDWEVARLILLNAAAVELLVAPEVGGDRASRIAAQLKICETKRQLVRTACDDCKGTTRRLMKVTSLDGAESYRAVPGMRCLACKGTGAIIRAGTLNEQKFALGQAVKRHKQLRLTLKHESVGEAWLPAGRADAFDVEQVALLRRTLAPPCRKCTGFGRAECGTCDGNGRVECRVRGCVEGKVEVEQEGRLVRSPGVHRAICKECDGVGVLECAKCRGSGGLVCKTCSGTGEGEPCSRCGGDAILPCRRCRGTGVYKDVDCTTCGGNKKTPCTTCGGDGRK